MIYCISKQMMVSASHRLKLDYESKCTRLHGHNWKITVFLASKEKDKNGMVADFTEIKRRIHGYLDHGDLNELLDFNPTAENIAEWCVGQFPQCYKAVVEETEGNLAMAIDDQFPIDIKCLL